MLPSEFLEHFDHIDQDALQPVMARGIVHIEPVDISEILKERPSTDVLFSRAKQTSDEIHGIFPEMYALWREYRQPLLDIKPLRRAFDVRFKDGSHKIVQSPYHSKVSFNYMPASRIPSELNLEDTAVAIAGNTALLASRNIRVLDDECMVANGVTQYEMFPYLVKALGLRKAMQMREPVTHALALMVGKFDPQYFLDNEHAEARRLYEQSKNARDLIQRVQNAA